MTGVAAKGSLADHPFRVGNRDPTEAGLDMYHEHDHGDRDDPEEEHREVADGAGLYVVVDRSDILRQRGDDAGEMMREIPLPTPCAVICSPSHMRKIVPAVSVIAMIRMFTGLGLRIACLRPMDMPTAWKKARTTVR